MTLGTRIAVMRDGGVEQAGAPLEIDHRPAELDRAVGLRAPGPHARVDAGTGKVVPRR